jgi:hypothetical protein
MIFKHLPILPLDRIEKHDPIQIHFLRLRLPPNQVGLPQKNHGPESQMGKTGRRPHHLRICTFRKNNPLGMTDQLFRQRMKEGFCTHFTNLRPLPI